MERIPMTAAGLQKLQDELKTLKVEERPSVVAAIKEARSHGDLSENAEYHAAREKQAFIEGRIMELESKLSRVDVIDIKSIKGSTVKFGATITLEDEESEEKKDYQLVGEEEADIQKGLLSIASPLGRALIGKAIGDSVEVRTPKGERYYEILNVQYV